MSSLTELKGMRETLVARQQAAEEKAKRCAARVKELDKEIAARIKEMQAEIEEAKG